MAFFDKLKAKASELGLDEKAALAKEKAAAAADANRGKIAGAVDKAASAVNDKTDGKYADKVAKAQDAAKQGVDKVAASGTAAGATGTTTGDFASTSVGSERAYDADLASGSGTSGQQETVIDFDPNETATQRTIGQDGLDTADDQFADESDVQRAIGADAPTSSFDTGTSFSAENADVTNAPITDPEINEARSAGGHDTTSTPTREAGLDAQRDATSFDQASASAGSADDVVRNNEPVTDPEINRIGGLPEDGPHGNTLR